MDEIDILFVPLNTNHVGIFQCVAGHLTTGCAFVCHDRISESPQYHTESTLKAAGLHYMHFPVKMDLKSGNLVRRTMAYLALRKTVKRLLESIRPRAVVLAMDNDPIAKAFIDEASSRAGCLSFMIQEGLVRPHEYTMRKRYLSDVAHGLLNRAGIYLKYIPYGTGGCDRYLLFGGRAGRIFQSRGVAPEKIFLVGQPKYDALLSQWKNRKAQTAEPSVLFAAPTDILINQSVLDLVKTLGRAAEERGVGVTVKLHPRSPASVAEVEQFLGPERGNIGVIKEGDDTFTLLGRHSILLTISSTVVLEALIVGREVITADYLAGEFRLDYEEYDAIHAVENKEDLEQALKDAMEKPKDKENKLRLLSEELHELDGNAGSRAAAILVPGK